MRVAEQRAGGCRKLVLAFRVEALIHESIWRWLDLAIGVLADLALDGELGNLAMTALQTRYAIRPAGGFQIGMAVLFGSENPCGVYDARSNSVCFANHTCSMRLVGF